MRIPLGRDRYPRASQLHRHATRLASFPCWVSSVSSLSRTCSRRDHGAALPSQGAAGSEFGRGRRVPLQSSKERPHSECAAVTLIGGLASTGLGPSVYC
ncbi:hypothetical protein GN956_G21702 [Arapaima gigas]